MVALSTADMISNVSSNIETTFTLSSLSFHRGKLQFECYFIIGLQDRYGIGDSSGAAQLTMDEVWL